MKLTLFQADRGDCLLISNDAGHHVLVDGGMSDAYSAHVAPALHALQKAGEVVDLVYVSHIDQDHISGVLQMMDDMMAWRVHDFQTKHGNPSHPEPDAPRPPKVKAIWHNSFHEQLKKNTGPIGDMLAAMSPVLMAGGTEALMRTAREFQNLATSEREAVRLSRRIGEGQLGIPLNPQFDGKLMLVTDPPTPVTIGGMQMFIVGPFEEDLAILRTKWNAWLRKMETKKFLRDLKTQSRADEKLLEQSDVERVLEPLIALAKVLGQRKEVTPPNLASLMMLLEGDGKSILLTGDGHWQDILAGLEQVGKFQADQSLHVNVLKVPHHGSEHNTHPTFCRSVIADHYVFCGNGDNTNPELDVIDAYLDSRLGTQKERSTHPRTDAPFTFWFTSRHTIETEEAKHRSHMRKVEDLVKKRAAISGGKLRFKFLEGSSRVLNL